MCDVGLTKWRNKTREGSEGISGKSSMNRGTATAYFGVPSRTYLGPMAGTRIQELMAIAL
jgi:hypothetical protein